MISGLSVLQPVSELIRNYKRRTLLDHNPLPLDPLRPTTTAAISKLLSNAAVVYDLIKL